MRLWKLPSVRRVACCVSVTCYVGSSFSFFFRLLVFLLIFFLVVGSIYGWKRQLISRSGGKFSVWLCGFLSVTSSSLRWDCVGGQACLEGPHLRTESSAWLPGPKSRRRDPGAAGLAHRLAPRPTGSAEPCGSSAPPHPGRPHPGAHGAVSPCQEALREGRCSQCSCLNSWGAGAVRGENVRCGLGLRACPRSCMSACALSPARLLLVSQTAWSSAEPLPFPFPFLPPAYEVWSKDTVKV